MIRITMLLSCVLVVTAEHSGAYSSPQYAKKMYYKPGYATKELLPREKAPIPFKYEETIDRFDGNMTDTTQYGSSSFLNTAGNILSGAGGEIVSGLARDFVAKSTGSSQVGFGCISQVLSLNLTNLVILVILKALILAAAFFGAGAWKGGHHYGRSLEDNKNATFISEDEILLYVSYLAGQQNKDYGCLYRMSCQKPQKASLYSSGAELLLQGVKLMQGNSVQLEEYEEIAKGIEQAAKWGQEGRSCAMRYKCEE